jgi:DNA/RNA endonuclease G (NUC1)
MFAKFRGRVRIAALGLALVACNADRLVAPTPATVAKDTAPLAALTGSQVVISQVYGGNGNVYQSDYVELFNRGASTVSLEGWTVQYSSATGTGLFSGFVTPLGGSIEPGHYYLVKLRTSTTGAVLPNPQATGTTDMSGSSGKVVLVNGGALACNGGSTACSPAQLALIVDAVGYGSANFFEGSAAPGASSSTALFRANHGCTDTDTNGADFSTGVPAPRNADTVKTCDAPPPPPVTVNSVVVSPETATITMNEPFTFTAVAKDADGNTITGASLTWASSDHSVATVSATGVITTVGAGATTISATSANGKIGSATLTVNALPPEPTELPDVVISQVYGGGGNSGAPYNADFVELFNRGDTPAAVAGWKLYYGSSSSSGFSNSAALPAGATIAPKSYYLVKLAGGATGDPLPAADATGGLNLSGTSGKVVLATATAAVNVACPTGTGIVDHVGYGSANCATDWNGQVAALSNTSAALRGNDGCTSTGSAASDFIVGAPDPRNSATPAKDCTLVPRPASSATVVINEVIGDPVFAESASWGEWFEVHNYGTAPVDLQGWTILSGGQPQHVIGESVVVAPGAYAVLGRGWDPTRNGGITLAYNYFDGAATIWLDNNDYLALVDNAGAKVDSLSWTTLPRGISRGLRDRTQPHVNVNGANWGYSTTTYGDGDYGTPGASNAPLSDTPPYVSPNTLSFSGRTASDAPIPVGFEAQAFASEKDAAGATIFTTITWTALTPELATIDSRGVIHGLAAGNARFRATATDGTTRVLTLVIEVPVASTTAQYLDHTAFGDPTDGNAADEIILRRPQYTTSFSATRMIPNWVAYDLNATHIASGQDRCNCFTFDPELEALGLARYTTADYTGAGSAAGYGIDRGHLVRSFDRTTATLDNARTYYFSNIIPQAADLNQGPWKIMEDDLGAMAQGGAKEVYIVAGASGSKGTVKDEGRITIPEYTWKVALVVPRGRGLADVQRVDDAEVIAVVMPNVPGIKNVDWNTYRVTVDSVEKLSGYDVLSLLDDEIEHALEAGDRHAPAIALSAPVTTITEGGAVTLDASASRDADGDAISYSWTIGADTVSTSATPTLTFADDGAKVVTLTVRDAYGAATRQSVTITVQNAAPVATLTSPTVSVVSGGTLEVTGGFTDAGVQDAPWQWAIDFGNGTAPSGSAASIAPVTRSATYLQAGSYTVTFQVTDKDGATGTATPLVISVERLAAEGSVSPTVINPNATGSGNVAFALLSQAGLDATTLDAGTARIGGVAPILKNKGEWFTESRDVNGDGFADLVVRFDRGELVKAGALASGQSSLVMTGDLRDGRQVKATAEVSVR